MKKRTLQSDFLPLTPRDWMGKIHVSSHGSNWARGGTAGRFPGVGARATRSDARATIDIRAERLSRPIRPSEGARTEVRHVRKKCTNLFIASCCLPAGGCCARSTHCSWNKATRSLQISRAFARPSHSRLASTPSDMAFPLATASGGAFASAFRRPRAPSREPSATRARASPPVSRNRRPGARTGLFEPSSRARGGALPAPAAATPPRARVVTRALDAEDELESARYEAEAAARAAADAEARHAAFVRSHPASLLDQAAADVETKRSAALRAADAASRARADAERFARTAEAAARRAAAIADSEACTYLSEARKKPADCAEQAAAAEAESRVARAAAIAAATEHAAAAERLVAERAARAERAERAAAAAAAEAAASERRSMRDARRSPPLSPSTERMNDIVPASVPVRDPATTRGFSPRATSASAVYHPPSGRASPDASRPLAFGIAKTSFAANVDENDAAARGNGARAEVTRGPDANRANADGSSEETNDAASRAAFADRVAAATGEVPEASAPEATGAEAAPATGGGGGGDDVADARASTSVGRGLPRDTIAPMPEWTYPRRLDAIPAFFGRLNPITGGLVYYTGAVLREATGAPLVALQWTFLVLVPALAAQCAIRLWAHRRRAERAALAAASRGETPEETFDFYRANRPAWLDVHLGYALLCPAGAVGGEGASWWLLLAPVFMFFRFVGHRFDAMRPARRVVAVVGGCVALAGLCFSASGALTQAIGSLRAAPPLLAVALAPVAFGLTYAFYLAPAALLPGAVARAWRGEGFDKPRDSAANAPAPMTPEEEAKEKANKRFWTLAGVAAMAVSLATGSDAPIFVVFFAQLLKADPSKLMQVMIDKGDPSRAEFEEKMAQGAANLFRRGGKDGDAGRPKTA